MSEPHRGYPSDVTDDEWSLAAPSLTPLRDDAHPRPHDLRQVLTAVPRPGTPAPPPRADARPRTPGLRQVLAAVGWLVKAGAHGRSIPSDFPPWPAVHRQARRW